MVVTAFDQGNLVREAVASGLAQTRTPSEVVVVDDGSTDERSVAVLRELAGLDGVTVLRQPNSGVSAARNAGLAHLTTDLAVVLDGDDTLEPTFVERTSALVLADPRTVAASSWLRLHGAVDALARPTGGHAVDFLHQNACPAAVTLRRAGWERCGGYREEMRQGLEDWDFFLSLLADGDRIAIVQEPLIRYRTTPASSNIRSMSHRLSLYGELVDRHRALFDEHLREVLIAHEAKAIRLMEQWEHAMATAPTAPTEASFGDGGMAAAVRIAGRRAHPAEPS